MKTKTLFTMLFAVMLCFFSICSFSKDDLAKNSPLMLAIDKNPQLSQFGKLLKTPGLDMALGSAVSKPFTLLAPTNEAMDALGAATLKKLSNPMNLNKITDFVKNQIIPGKLNISELKKAGLKSASGQALELGAAKLGKMISGDNFNLYPINKVLGTL